jgi:tRNA (cytidine/uridine-2'-O-)-methyltransferase
LLNPSLARFAANKREISNPERQALSPRSVACFRARFLKSPYCIVYTYLSSCREGTNRRNPVVFPSHPGRRQASMRVALYQPDIPQNTGTILRMAACLNVDVDVIGPAGFDISDRALRRAGLDYLDRVRMMRHQSFAEFESRRRERGGRLLLLTTAGATPYAGFSYHAGDTLLVGRESAGVPINVHESADIRLKVPMTGGLRSLNVAVALAMVLGEALRQTGHFDTLASAASGTGQA